MIEIIDGDDDAICMETARELVMDNQLPLDLIVSSCFGFLAAKIKLLENPNLSIKEALAILDSAVSTIETAVGPRAEKVQAKMRRVLDKNEGLTLMRRASAILEGTSNTEESSSVRAKLTLSKRDL